MDLLKAWWLFTLCTAQALAIVNCPMATVKPIIQRSIEAAGSDAALQMQDIYGGTWGVLIVRGTDLVSTVVHWTIPDHKHEDGSPAFCLHEEQDWQYNVFKTGNQDTDNRITVEQVVHRTHFPPFPCQNRLPLLNQPEAESHESDESGRPAPDSLIYYDNIKGLIEAGDERMLETDRSDFQTHLEWLVGQLGPDSEPYIEERPRFGHGVLVLANPDQPGELVKASLIRQLDSGFSEDSAFYAGVTFADVQGSRIHRAADKVEPLHKSEELPYLPLSKYVSHVATPPLNVVNNYNQIVQQTTRLAMDQSGPQSPTGGFESSPSLSSATNTHSSTTNNEFAFNKLTSHTYDNMPLNAATFDYSVSIPQMQGTYYERPEVVHRTYRSHIEETTFPSIDRFRNVRQEGARMSDQPTSPYSRCSSSTPTFTSMGSSIPSQQTYRDDAIEKAVKILKDSCEMLDETAERIANHRRNQMEQSQRARQYSSAIQFPSEVRSANY